MRRGNLIWVILAILAVVCLVLVFNGGDGTIAGLPEGQFASLAYYAVWGLALASGAVLMLRTNLSGALKSAAVWALAFLVLISAYAYMPELVVLKNRVTAVLVPGTPVAIDGPGGNRFMAVRGIDDHFHLTGTINGEPASFMVDTGATMIAMDRSSAQAIGINTDRLRYSREVMTANGIARAAPVTLGTVKIGGIVRHDVPAAVTDSDGLGVILLGMSYLNTLRSFDFRGDRLILTD